MEIRAFGDGTAVVENEDAMWSEDPERTQPKKEEPKDGRRAEQVSTGPLRWFFSFDGWRLDPEEDQFVLA